MKLSVQYEKEKQLQWGVRVEVLCKELCECREKNDEFSQEGIRRAHKKEMIFELYPKGWVGFHQAGRRRGNRIPSRGNSMCKSSLKHIEQFFLPSLEGAHISCTNAEFGFSFFS